MPLLGGLLLNKLVYYRADSAEQKGFLSAYKSLFRELAQRRELGELVKFLIQYSSRTLPVKQTSLYIYDHHLAQLELAANWNTQDADATLRLTSSSRICHTCLASHHSPIHAATVHKCPFANSLDEKATNEFCLSLSYNKVLIGTLRLICQDGKTFSQEQIEFMNAIASEVALALAIAIANPRQMAQVRMQTQLMERQQTAIDLHNALAQQIGFLHLGLDRIAGDEKMDMGESVRAELEQMRLTASEAYGQVRNMLALLRSWESVDLTQAIMDYSFKVAQRAQLLHRFTTTGSSISLPASLRRQIFSLLQEALNNIEKHAFAQQICINLIWSEDYLSIDIEDDGVGFHPPSIQTYGHYGLIMMHELAKTMHGDLEVDSAASQGTRLKLKVPLSDQCKPVAETSWSMQAYAFADPPLQTKQEFDLL